MNNTQSPAIILIAIIAAIIILIVSVGKTLRPIANELIRRYEHKQMIEARRREFYSGISVLMGQESKSGFIGK
jgi:hypothetical protein